MENNANKILFSDSLTDIGTSNDILLTGFYADERYKWLSLLM